MMGSVVVGFHRLGSVGPIIINGHFWCQCDVYTGELPQLYLASVGSCWLLICCCSVFSEEARSFIDIVCLILTKLQSLPWHTGFNSSIQWFESRLGSFIRGLSAYLINIDIVLIWESGLIADEVTEQSLLDDSVHHLLDLLFLLDYPLHCDFIREEPFVASVVADRDVVD
jgi:hypothetical protein